MLGPYVKEIKEIYWLILKCVLEGQRSVGNSFGGAKVLVGAIYKNFLILSWPSAGTHHFWHSIYLANTACPTQAFPFGPTLPNLPTPAGAPKAVPTLSHLAGGLCEDQHPTKVVPILPQTTGSLGQTCNPQSNFYPRTSVMGLSLNQHPPKATLTLKETAMAISTSEAGSDDQVFCTSGTHGIPSIQGHSFKLGDIVDLPNT